MNSIWFTIWSCFKVTTSLLGTCSENYRSSNGSACNRHEVWNIIVLTITEHLELKHFPSQPTTVADIYVFSSCRFFNGVFPWSRCIPSIKQMVLIKLWMFKGSPMLLVKEFGKLLASYFTSFKGYFRTETALIAETLCLIITYRSLKYSHKSQL